MGIPLTRQLSAVVYAIFTGALLGVLYDCIRILRVLFGIASYTRGGRRLCRVSLPLIGTVRRVPAENKRRTLKLILLFIGDILFAFLAGCTVCVFLYHAASGCFRWFYLLGACVGFFAWYFTVGKLVMLSSEVLAFVIFAVLRYVQFMLLAPFRFLWWLLCRMGKWIYRRICHPLAAAVRRRQRIRYTRRVRAALVRDIRFLTE